MIKFSLLLKYQFIHTQYLKRLINKPNYLSEYVQFNILEP